MALVFRGLLNKSGDMEACLSDVHCKVGRIGSVTPITSCICKAYHLMSSSFEVFVEVLKLLF